MTIQRRFNARGGAVLGDPPREWEGEFEFKLTTPKRGGGCPEQLPPLRQTPQNFRGLLRQQSNYGSHRTARGMNASSSGDDTYVITLPRTITLH